MTGLLFIPGSFDPLHYGHLGIADEASKLSGRSPTFLIDRPMTSDILRMFGPDRHVIVDDVPRWAVGALLERAGNHPGAHFVIGAEAFEVFLTSRWYPVSRALERLAALKTVLYVAPRVTKKQLITMQSVLDHTGIEASGLFVPLTRVYDISSAELRVAHAQIAGRRD